jgi:ABC-2 type transport system ATP-binding protein
LVKIRVDRPLKGPLKMQNHLSGEPLGEAGKDVVTTRIDDVSHHLTDLLHSVRQNGYDVSDVEVHAPSLQHVFLHLTGNELRDG